MYEEADMKTHTEINVVVFKVPLTDILLDCMRFGLVWFWGLSLPRGSVPWGSLTEPHDLWHMVSLKAPPYSLCYLTST